MFLSSPSTPGNIPKRIVSLVPSQTELLYHLGLDSETVGITKFCVHPKEWFASKTRVGGTKTIDMGIIDNLQPDLIIANKEENVKEQVEALATHYPVWLTDVNNLSEALQMIGDIGQLTGKSAAAVDLSQSVSAAFSDLKEEFSTLPPHKTAYLIWQKPFMAAGGDTFINDMLLQCRLQNVFAAQKRYPEISLQDLQDTGCELVLLSSEPYPFKELHREELQELLPSARVILVDGEMFSWYGSRLLLAAAYFKQLRNNIL